MPLFESILLLLVAAVALAALARRIGAPYPALLALAGAALALAPIDVPVRLDPALALTLFVAPVLMDAAYDTSPRDLRFNWLPVGLLVLVVVGLTTAAVAVVARLLVPDLPWAAAIALGAIVAPPDASAATAVLRQVRPPHRIMVLLEGESLLNDASALLVFKVAAAAALADGAFHLQNLAPLFLLSVVGSVCVGWGLAQVVYRVLQRLQDAPSSIVMQFVTTFGVWIAADRLGLSPILTIVAYAITVARSAPARTGAALRVPSYAVWDTAVLVLNALAFVLIGLQLGPILASAPPAELAAWLLFAGAVLLAVLLVRPAWVMTYNTWLRLKNARFGTRLPPGATRPTWQGGVIISWCGMRGIVTLAAALSLPDGFPHRDLLLFTAFVVTLATLVLQGLTLRPLLLALRMPEDGIIEAEVRRARVELAAAALVLLDGQDGPEIEALRREFDVMRRTAEAAADGEGRTILPINRLRKQTLARRRQRLLELRRESVIGDEAFHRIEAELDYAELGARSGG